MSNLQKFPTRNQRVNALETRPFVMPTSQGVIEICYKDETLDLTLRFIPHKLTLNPKSLADYTTALLPDFKTEIEAFAALCLDDLFDTLVPKYLEVIALSKDSKEYTYRCTFHKAQPGFNLPEELKPLFY